MDNYLISTSLSIQMLHPLHLKGLTRFAVTFILVQLKDNLSDIILTMELNYCDAYLPIIHK